MTANVITVLCTCPDTATGERIATALVEDRVAACVNLLPRVRSFYRWEGRVNDDAEVLLIIKSAASRFDDIEARVKALHPYDVPELIALPVETGSNEYLGWLTAESADR